MVGQYGGYFATTAPWNGTNFGTFNPSADWVDVPYKDMFTEFYPNFQTIKESTGGTGYILCVGIYSAGRCYASCS